ncbi:MAG TPA: YitT family protein [Kosmotogaceae bacterium]|nr:MAG: Uncharacterized protein XE05_0335 [Thermotogales bacterium 46_20]HAA85181.1 YitT family protein [Kosmotogaceae bacterium]
MNAREQGVDYVLITAGSFLTAVAVVSFMLPNGIIAGGVSGLAIILNSLFGWWVGAQMLAYNLFLFLLAFSLLGLGFGVKSIYSSVALSIMIDLMNFLEFPAFKATSVSDGGLLVAIYGGALAGLGMGLVMWRGASTGGTDIIAMILNKYMGISTGSGLLLTDTIIALLAVLVFGPLAAMYGIITIFVTSKAIDGVLEGAGNTRTAFIVSKSFVRIKERILDEMDRGVTMLNAFGGYTGEGRPLIMVALRRREIPQLRRILKDEDPQSFMVMVNNSEIFGEGFKRVTS